MDLENFLPSFERPSRFDPPEVYRDLRRDGSLVQTKTATGETAWVVFGAEMAQQVLSDRRFQLTPMGTTPPEMGLLFCDGDEHARLRRSLSQVFNARNLERMRPRINQLARKFVVNLQQAGPPADLVTDLARPFSLAVITEILGIPVDDRDRFYGWADAVSGLTAGVGDYESAWNDLIEFLGKLTAAKRANPGEDLLSVLVGISDTEDGRLSDRETVMLGASLLSGGQLTTTNALSIGLIKLIPQGGLARIVDEKDVSLAVEEMFRHQTGISGEALPRWASANVEVAGVSIVAGELVLVSLEAANRDPAWFGDPDRFDPQRTINPHLRFGYGPHRCVGAALARMELTAAVTELAQRIPGMTITCAAEDIPWTGHPLDDGPAALPVTW
jgi:cytochrome P450